MIAPDVLGGETILRRFFCFSLMGLGKWMLVSILLVCAAPAVRAGDWGSLGRLSKTQTVKVHLRDGRVLKGTVQRVGADILSLVDENRLTVIKTRDIQSTQVFEDGEVRVIEGNSPSIHTGQAVELTIVTARYSRAVCMNSSRPGNRCASSKATRL